MAHPGGRPTVMTKDVIAKLEQAFAIGCTDLEACLFAGVSKDALYYYQHKNPKFTERKEQLKETPILKARTSVVNKLEADAELALKFLERKKKDEFSPRVEKKNSGEIKHTFEKLTKEQRETLKQSLDLIDE